MSINYIHISILQIWFEYIMCINNFKVLNFYKYIQKAMIINLKITFNELEGKVGLSNQFKI